MVGRALGIAWLARRSGEPARVDAKATLGFLMGLLRQENISDLAPGETDGSICFERGSEQLPWGSASVSSWLQRCSTAERSAQSRVMFEV
ncbi:MAG: hypothetical protein ACI9EF_002341 [Pseudohongiellaceae bacterium]|jgi:hypothetical protein